MIVIKVELHSARTGRVTTLGQAIITNEGTNPDPRRGDYKLSIGRKQDAEAGNLRAIITRPSRTAEVKEFPRHSYTIWRMILRLLRAAYPEDKIDNGILTAQNEDLTSSE